MRIRVNANTMTDEGILTPVDPPPPINIGDLFELTSFRAQKVRSSPIDNSLSPFEEVRAEWIIVPKDPSTQFDNFVFSLVTTEEVLEHDINNVGSFTFAPYQSTMLSIRGRRRSGGITGVFDQKIFLTIDDSSCRREEILGFTMDSLVSNALTNLTDDTQELRLRGDIKPKWTIEYIEYDIPLEIVLNNFFNGNLDVSIKLFFDVHHDGENSDLEVRIEHSSNVNFHWLEDTLSVGSASIIARTANRLIPIILDCEMSRQETQIVRQIIGVIRRRLNTHRLLDVNIVPPEVGAKRLEIILCRFPVRPINPDTNSGNVLDPL